MGGYCAYCAAKWREKKKKKPLTLQQRDGEVSLTMPLAGWIRLADVAVPELDPEAVHSHCVRESFRNETSKSVG